MFFIMGITNGRKDFSFNQFIICNNCGRYGRYNVFMTYMSLSLFFLPVFKWSKKYYVQTSCCGIVYELDPQIGRRIARGENVEILPQHLTATERRWGYTGGYKKCRNCGYETTENFVYCPRCGTEF